MVVGGACKKVLKRYCFVFLVVFFYSCKCPSELSWIRVFENVLWLVLVIDVQIMFSLGRLVPCA